MNGGAPARKAFDTGWTLAATYAGFVALSAPLQRRAWTLVASDPDRLVAVVPILLLFLVTVGTLALSAYLAPATSERLFTRLTEWFRVRRRFALALLLALAIIASGAIAYAVLDRFQDSGDEFAYVFQAKLFAKGHLWAAAPPLGDTFVPYRTWIIGDKWLSQYPPGWPLAMALAIVAGVPAWFLNTLLGVGTATALLSPLWRFKDGMILLAAVALYVLTPFYLLNAASFHSHMLSALLILSFCLSCLWYQRDHRAVALIASGMLLGLIGLTRYYSLILLLPSLCYWLLVENHQGRPRMIALWVLGGIPFLGLLMTYHDLITGSPLRSTYSLITIKDVYVSFAPCDVALGAKLTAYRLEELSLWASPTLLPVYLYCLVRKLKSRSIAFYDLIFPSFVVGYLFFADIGGNRYGPRYYFDAFPLMLATIVSAAPYADAAGRLCKRPLAIHAIFMSAIYLLTALPFALVAYHRHIESQQEPYRLSSAKGLNHAVVVIEKWRGRGLEPEDLARNDPGLQAPVLYARAGVTVGELRRVFPSRSIWVYDRDDPKKPGRLEPVSASVPADTRLER